jgi:putative endonuclease
MTQARRETGASGEELAARYLTRRGWTIIARNWRCPTGEIDLVARDPEGCCVLVEVKCRRGLGFGDPLEAITWSKVRRLRRLAAEWLASLDHPESSVRIDAVGVLAFTDGTSRVSHVRGIGA